ncbi:hypothetical protein EDD21DRAFT_191332 [Dissophora ornata]|nr:hypothetical protein EDD21DRAFT_191332 [Dissophora ornata]
MDFPQRYKKHCPSSSPCRSEIEASYTALDLENPTSIPQRQSSSSPWTTNNTISSSPSPIVSDPVTSPEMSSYRDPLRIIHGTPRVAKTTFPQYPTSIQRHADYLHRPRNALASLSLDVAHEGQSSPSSTQYRTAANMEGPAQHERQHHQHLPSSATRQRSHSPPLPRMRSASGPRRSSVCSGPRSSERLPFVFARIKAKLEAPRRPAIPVITTCPLPIFRATNSFSEEDDRCPSTPSSPLHPLQPIPDDNHYPGEHSYPPQSPSPILTLFGIACSAASQRAYSNTNSDIERSFFKLQHEDSGRVEHRTIGNVND